MALFPYFLIQRHQHIIQKRRQKGPLVPSKQVPLVPSKQG